MTTNPTHIQPSRALALALTIFIGGTLTGACTTLDTGGAGSSYAYIMGEMTTTETAYLPAGFEVARTVLEGRGYRIKTSDRDEIRGTLLAENPEGGQARIDLDQLGIQKLRISIRIGIVGDREESRQILDSIRSRLAA
ncbi:DUF3568 family protein [Nodularia spumigena]|uniref:DUF3568 family protein n=1 Tax=Nodularia spumigena TaxID=70799 RepID=UPI002B2111CD|nr:DUF3568 family protein [Nodularia spumigena]MEA5557681.1 DUF3568 family protein [Nodularia spumigena CH309]